MARDNLATLSIPHRGQKAPEHEDAPDAILLSCFRALGEPHRLHIFRDLMQSELCVCELEEQTGFSGSLLAHHLKVLRQSGLIQVRRGARDARWLYYSISPTVFGELRQALAGLLCCAELPTEARYGSNQRCG